MHRSLSLILSVTLLAAACGGVDVGSIEPGQASDVDLTDASTLARLGIPEPSIDWQRSIERLTYTGSGAAPSEAEVGLVRAVIEDVPLALWEKADVRWVVRGGPGALARPNHPDAVAFAVGPDVYLLDNVFALSDGGSTRYDLSRAVVHELVHVAQFQTMSADYLAAAFDGRLDQLDPVDGSVVVREFATATGWTDASSDPLRPSWSLAGPAASPYGATGPGEDMAESVAMVVLGLEALIPSAHVDWVESWLGTQADSLSIGQPWAPVGSVEVLSTQPLYDADAVAAARGSLPHAEPLYFQLPDGSSRGEIIASSVEDRLRERVMSGSLDRLDDEFVPRWGGTFIGPSGRLWWVELWDFANAAPGTTGPTGPVLVYVALW